ncbi:ABC transporter permease [Xanthobacteraceae bacterium Astr-EGSB]|uniref:ABC transporter permease n=1 Tax=Astrobacterium formosum TaxID=3069710 RepID=UPI0027B01062|nr:ABC transporter permease [Xanthobacteraceae bacterium Astr-EGSB]
MPPLLSHPLALRFVSFGAVLALWEYAGRAGVNAVFPSVSETALAWIALAADGSLGKALAVTLTPLVIGVVVSALAGIGIGLLMGLSRRAEWLGVPFFIVLQAAPLAAIIPMLILAYGIGLATKVAVVCVMAVPVIVLNSYKAVRHTPGSLLEMGQSFLATRPQMIAKVMLPSASPVIFAGLRLGVAAGFIGAILAELLISPTGIGDLITYHQSVADYPRMYAAIVTIIVMSLVFLEVLGKIEVSVFRPEKRASP